jgi:hypothetical protein
MSMPLQRALSRFLPRSIVRVFIVVTEPRIKIFFLDADKVCARAKIHFDPAAHLAGSESGVSDASAILEKYKTDYLPVHPAHSQLMHFSVGSAFHSRFFFADGKKI